MLGAGGLVLYVGKAKNLKKRLSSYFRTSGLPPRTRKMISQVEGIEICVTRSEAEALLLESQLIKGLRPRYNILFRDDKTYPYLAFSTHPYPRLYLYRGTEAARQTHFGPYADAGAAREAIRALQQVFFLRTCRDGVFNHRTRPCLLHQIKRCSAPCTDKVTLEQYTKDTALAKAFLEGRGRQALSGLEEEMQAAAACLDFERAARLRDQIGVLKRVQEKQCVILMERGDADVFAVAMEGSRAAVHRLSLRAGCQAADDSHLVQVPIESRPEEVLESFLAQHYLLAPVPAEIILSHPRAAAALKSFLRQKEPKKVSFPLKLSSEKKALLEMAMANARLALGRHEPKSGWDKALALQKALGLAEPPRRIECWDISHTRGEATTASCVVFRDGIPDKSQYRRYHITGIAPGDDFAALAQGVSRRYAKDGPPLPDVLLIDGGRGQLRSVSQALKSAALFPKAVLAVAKGEKRLGDETLWRLGQEEPVDLPKGDPALHLLLQARDEAHRFAVEGHRRRREKSRLRSALDDIEGIGEKRRRKLLSRFGGVSGLAKASEEEIAQVAGIGPKLVEKISLALHACEPTSNPCPTP